LSHFVHRDAALMGMDGDLSTPQAIVGQLLRYRIQLETLKSEKDKALSECAQVARQLHDQSDKVSISYGSVCLKFQSYLLCQECR
jgi:hypothetical protein